MLTSHSVCSISVDIGFKCTLSNEMNKEIMCIVNGGYLSLFTLDINLWKLKHYKIKRTQSLVDKYVLQYFVFGKTWFAAFNQSWLYQLNRLLAYLKVWIYFNLVKLYLYLAKCESRHTYSCIFPNLTRLLYCIRTYHTAPRLLHMYICTIHKYMLIWFLFSEQ